MIIHLFPLYFRFFLSFALLFVFFVSSVQVCVYVMYVLVCVFRSLLLYCWLLLSIDTASSAAPLGVTLDSTSHFAYLANWVRVLAIDLSTSNLHPISFKTQPHHSTISINYLYLEVYHCIC